ncbi:hypothetical protein LTR37_012368 [Vermiconidia calcicola]|uniref:Uncharacterized protein n=1 Tax=Vermiconidia calcicola TaxID=1690605 RepID=A0ACC3N299_9PEZI|nr:hypothetical protein LTR37_012368 [Vermiconidia calcicola]
MATTTAASGLLDLPLELHELVCSNLPTTGSLKSLRLVCREADARTIRSFARRHVGTITISLRKCDLQELLAISRKHQFADENSGTNGSRRFRALDHAFEATTTALHACRASNIELRAGTTRSHKGLFDSLTLQTLEGLLTPEGLGVHCKLRALELSLRITHRDELFGKSRQIPTAFAFMTNLQSLSLDFRYGSYNRPEADKIIDYLFEEITLARLRTLRLRWAICQGKTLRGFLLRHADTLKQVALHGHRFTHYLERGEILNLFDGPELHLEKILLTYIGYDHGFLCDPQEESKPFRECGHVVYNVDATCRLCNAATIADGHPSVVLPKMKERFLNMGYVKWLTEDHLTG